MPIPAPEEVINVYVFTFTPVQSTPLHLAAGFNRVNIVRTLLKHGADVHAKDKGLVPQYTYVYIHTYTYNIRMCIHM